MQDIPKINLRSDNIMAKATNECKDDKNRNHLKIILQWTGS